MIRKKKRLGELLVEACLITQAQLEEALQVQEGKQQLLGQILVEMGWVSEQEVCRAVSELLHIRYVDVEGALISQDVVQLAPERLAAKRNILPLFIQDKTLYLAMENPLDVDAIQRIEFHTGMQVQPLIAPPSQLRETVRKHYNVDEYVGNMLAHVTEKTSFNVENQDGRDDSVDISEVRKISEGSQVVKLVNLLVADGIKKRASDIHIESTAKYVNVRYRIDGLLSRGIRVPHWLQLPLISRIKVIAGMDIAEHRKPQDGRIRVTYDQRKIDLRVSTLLTNFGEKVVIRILDQKTSSHDLTRLGLSPRQLNVFRKMLQQPQGWILVTGPTGSGKTTTLYASLNAIKDVTKNIVTVEDPIEYQLEGINQVQVNPKAGLTFASGLRSILRQDPNVILVGEIRDTETAEIAMQAAETGHLVLSTLHTNDAISTVNRLFNLGLAPDVVASNLLAVVAQRLVRRICPHCKTSYTPTREELSQLGFSDHQAGFPCYKGRGCSVCQQSGYYGQVGVYELFIQNDEIGEEIAKRPTHTALKRLARQAGMQSMLEDGIEKIREGITTIEEVARVCPVDRDEVSAAPVRLEDDGNVEKTARMCSHCQATLDRAWRFCPFCGTRIVVSADLTSQEFTEKPAIIPLQQTLDPYATRILTADDEAHVREMVTLLLTQQGYQVFQAADGEEALAKIRTELPDLVILDVNMPKKNGFEVCKAIRTTMETMFMPVVMLTAQDTVEEKLHGLSSGADDYITKPFNTVEFLARIETVLRRSYRSLSEAQHEFIEGKVQPLSNKVTPESRSVNARL